MRKRIAMLVLATAVATPQAIRPFLVECRKCVDAKTIDTGNSTSGGGKIVVEREKCRGCVIEFRVDSECLPPPVPSPGL